MATNPLAPMSYTNKDFNAIYTELLEITKQLSSKWDPTVSNESDPGVVLLKLNAIIADKNNYNIDKNVLEAFPETVTQDQNARNMYKQLAYNMPWYRSATTKVTYKWVGRDLEEGETITIPKYTSVTNEDDTVTYVTMEEAVLSSESNTSTVSAIEGSVITHKINGSEIIELVNLDYQNRVYLNDYTVSENGVFIENIDTGNQWEQVDNLQIKTAGNYYYEFGVDSRNRACYIEFPEDIDKLIGTGLRITYIVSNGVNGNIAPRTLCKFSNETTVSISPTTETVLLNDESVQLYNFDEANNGSDPQSIEDAYKSYRRVAGTFNTLVTLRDYMNAIYQSEIVSNDIVTDRSNDIQSAYVVMTEDEVNSAFIYNVKSYTNKVSFKKADTSSLNKELQYFEYSDSGMKKVTDAKVGGNYYILDYDSRNDNEMTAFDLKLYLLHSPGSVTSVDSYESTFSIEKPDNETHKKVINSLYNKQCISHDYQSIKPYVPCMFFNTYPLGIKIVPISKLTQDQITQVKKNIIKALWDVCESRSQDFGNEPTYDIIYDAIQQADNRIKVVILDDFDYTTYAAYYDAEEKEFKEIPISDTDSEQVIHVKDESDAKSVLQKYKDVMGKMYSAYFIVDEDSDGIWKKNNILRYSQTEKQFKKYSDLLKDIRLQVISKNILAGRTSLFKQEADFTYTIDQSDEANIGTDRITTCLQIEPFADIDSDLGCDVRTVEINGTDRSILVPAEISREKNEAKYTLKENETIRMFAPSFISETTYSNYVKFEMVLTQSSGKRMTSLQYSFDNPPLGGTKLYVSKSDYRFNLFKALSKSLFFMVDVTTGKPLFKLSGVDTTLKNASFLLYYGLCNGCVCATSTGSITTGIPYLYSNGIDDIPSKYLWNIESSSTSLDSFILKNENKYLKTAGTSVYLTDKKSDAQQFSWSIVTGLPNNIPEDAVKNLVSTSYAVQLKSEDKKYLYVDKSVSVQTLNPDLSSDISTQYENNPDVFNGEYVTFNPSQENIDENFSNSYFMIQWPEIDFRTIDESNSDRETKEIQKKNKILEAVLNEYRNNLADAYSNYFIVKQWLNEEIILSVPEDIYEIEANTDYQLKEGDYIAFFWREVDEKDAPYIYVKYSGIATDETSPLSKSPIIRPSFKLVGTPEGKVRGLHDKGEIPYGDTNFEIVNNFYGDNDLSASKQIEIRKINQTKLDSAKSRFYVFTNNKYTKEVNENETVIKKEYYRMTMKPVKDVKDTDKTINYRYTLQNNEYLVNMNSTFTEAEILGPGTLVGLIINAEDIDSSKKSEFIIENEAIDYNEMITKGTSVITSYSTIVKSFWTMYVREQQVYNIVSGDKLVITTSDSNSSSTPRPHFYSWEDTYVENFDMYYVTSDGSRVSLPKLLLQDKDSLWYGRACLNIDCSYNNSQEIIGYVSDKSDEDRFKSYQFIIFDDEEGKEKILPEQKFQEKTVSRVIYLQSNIILNVVGGQDVDISYIDGYGDRKETDLYMYSIYDVFKNKEGPYQVQSDGNIIVDLSKVGSNGEFSEFNLKLKEGRYLLSIQNTSDSAGFLIQVKEKDGVFKEIQPLNATILGSEEVYFGTGYKYYELVGRGPDFEDSEIYRIKAKLPETSGSNYYYQLIIKPLIRFDTQEDAYLKYNISYDDLIQKIKELDYDSKFKYDYVVDSSVEIKDPLQSVSFFDENHFFNLFTIARAQLRMSNTTPAYLEIVNNR